MERSDMLRGIRLETSVADPRPEMAEEDVRYLPACDGGEWPEVGALDAIARQQIEFLALYYHLNRLHGHLERMRAVERDGEGEAAVIVALHRTIQMRDELEDRCAPYGFDAEPVMCGPFAVNVIFQHAQRQVLENHRRLHPLEARVKVPIPVGVRDADLVGIRGLDPETIRADLDLRRKREDRGGKGGGAG